MQDKDLHYPGQSIGSTGMTVFLFGQSGTWKTTWAGTWPSPIFLSCGVEGGDDSLAMLPFIFGEQMKVPPVYQITSVAMMRQKVDTICRYYEQMAWKTVVIDSITFYADLWIHERLKDREEKYKQMTTRDWGALENHIVKELAQRLHATRLNVIWIALEKQRTKTAENGDIHIEEEKPHVQGGTAVKLPAACKMIIHAKQEFSADMSLPGSGRMKGTPVYYTAPSRLARGVRTRYGVYFPEGCLVDPGNPNAQPPVPASTLPTFAAVDSRIGTFIYK